MSVGDGSFSRLVLASDVIAFALVGHEPHVWLHHHRVEVLDSVVQLGKQCSTRLQGQPQAHVGRRVELGETVMTIWRVLSVEHPIEWGVGVHLEHYCVAMAEDLQFGHHIVLLVCSVGGNFSRLLDLFLSISLHAKWAQFEPLAAS